MDTEWGLIQQPHLSYCNWGNVLQLHSESGMAHRAIPHFGSKQRWYNLSSLGPWKNSFCRARSWGQLCRWVCWRLTAAWHVAFVVHKLNILWIISVRAEKAARGRTLVTKEDPDWIRLTPNYLLVTLHTGSFAASLVGKERNLTSVPLLLFLVYGVHTWGLWNSRFLGWPQGDWGLLKFLENLVILLYKCAIFFY